MYSREGDLRVSGVLLVTWAERQVKDSQRSGMF